MLAMHLTIWACECTTDFFFFFLIGSATLYCNYRTPFFKMCNVRLVKGEYMWGTILMVFFLESSNLYLILCLLTFFPSSEMWLSENKIDLFKKMQKHTRTYTSIWVFFPSRKSRWEAIPLSQWCCHCSKHFWNYL